MKNPWNYLFIQFLIGSSLNLKTQQKLWVFNTHFDHRGTLARSKSADLILQKIQELNGEKLPVILTGDFNLTPDSAPIKKIQSQMTDAQQNLPASDPQYATSNGFDTEKRGTKRIDYIFTKFLFPKLHLQYELDRETPLPLPSPTKLFKSIVRIS